MRLHALLPLCIVALFASAAHAQPGMSPPGQSSPYYKPPTYVQQPQPLPTRTTSYGLQVFAADAASWVLVAAASGGSDSEGLASIGALGMLLGGPIVHLAQGNNSGAGYSLLARTGLPFGGAMLGAATCEDDHEWDCLGAIFGGAMLGYASALAIDWFYLAKKTEVIAPAAGWASLRPSVQLRDGGAQAGVAFNF